MKQLSLTFALMAVMLGAINAQSDSSMESIQFGLKIGGNLANVYDSSDESFNADPKAGLAIGAFLSIPFGPYIGVQPELMFSQKGYQTSGRVLGVDYSYKHTSNYLDVPIFFAVKPIPYLTILAGPQFSYLLGERKVFDNTIFDPVVTEKEFENQDVRRNTLGFVFGGDININRFVIGLRAGYDILNNNGDGTQTTPRYKNAYYQGTIGVRF